VGAKFADRVVACFATHWDEQQESRLAPIGRGLVRLFRGGVLRTGCFPRQTAFQGGHEIDDGRRGLSLGLTGSPLILASISSCKPSW
jgi:hypothetical protein